VEGRDLVYSIWGYGSSCQWQVGGGRGSQRIAPVAVWSPWSALCGQRLMVILLWRIFLVLLITCW